MDKFQPGNVPHYFIAKAFGEFAINNRLSRHSSIIFFFKTLIVYHPAFCVVPSLEDVIGRCLPVLGMIKFDNMRYIFSRRS